MPEDEYMISAACPSEPAPEGNEICYKNPHFHVHVSRNNLLHELRAAVGVFDAHIDLPALVQSRGASSPPRPGYQPPTPIIIPTTTTTTTANLDHVVPGRECEDADVAVLPVPKRHGRRDRYRSFLQSGPATVPSREPATGSGTGVPHHVAPTDDRLTRRRGKIVNSPGRQPETGRFTFGSARPDGQW